MEDKITIVKEITQDDNQQKDQQENMTGQQLTQYIHYERQTKSVWRFICSPGMPAEPMG